MNITHTTTIYYKIQFVGLIKIVFSHNHFKVFIFLQPNLLKENFFCPTLTH